MSTSMRQILKLHRFDNKKVLQAVEELRSCGGLEDGSLEGVDLRYVHLHSADLHNADLKRVNLSLADLRWADLSGADLRGAYLGRTNLYRTDLREANLQGANLIWTNLCCAQNVSIDQLALTTGLFGTAMPDGSIYDGRLTLPGDIEIAYLRGIDFNNPESMANFYGVSIDEYMQGQKWVHDHLPFFGARKETLFQTGIGTSNSCEGGMDEEQRLEDHYSYDPYRNQSAPSI